MRARMIRIACLGALALAAGCVSTEQETVLAKGGLAPDPEPGTRACYERHVVGKYAMYNDRAIPVQNTSTTNTSPSFAFWIEGDLLACVDGFLLLNVADAHVPGGTVGRHVMALSPLGTRTNLLAGDRLRVLAVRDGTATATEEGNGVVEMAHLREVSAVSFEDYLRLSAPALAGRVDSPSAFDWIVLAEEDFRSAKRATVRVEALDPGLAWSVEGGRGLFHGKTADAVWGENTVILPVAGDGREWLELTADFTVTSDPAQLIVELQGKGDQPEAGIAPLAVQYATWRDRPSQYRLSTDWLLVPHRVEANSVFDAAFGDEATNPHRMRIVIDRKGRRINYFADNRWLGMVLLDGEVGPVTQLRFKVDTPDPAVRVDCRVYNLRVRAAGNPHVFGISGKSDEGRQRSSPTPGSVALEIPFTFTTNNNTITITKYIGPGGDVVVPSEIEGLAVTSLGLWSFSTPYARTNLTAITLPHSLTHIGWYAFNDCTSLTNITIPRNVSSIGGRVFCGTSSLSSIDVAAENAAYSSLDGVLFCKQQTRLISFPGGKTGGYTIPSSVSSMNECAFADCNGLTSVLIPYNVSSIAWCAFSGCKRLADVRIHEGVDKMEGHAFAGCTNLTYVTIPRSISSIGVHPFIRCTALVSIEVDAANPFYSSRDGVLFDKKGTRLIQCPGGKIGHYWVPASVSCIEKGSFSSCSRLTAITFPESVMNFGEHAFDQCRELAAIYFEGNAPTGGADRVFLTRVPHSRPVIYRRSEAKGWGETFGGRPVKIWDPANPLPPAATPSSPVPGQPAASLKVGDPAPALVQGKYVQGESVAAFEKGKVYVIEFWATWCGPCRAVIPHVNALQEKYRAKGLVVIGQNVWQRSENVEADVTAFVKEMGERMTYRVALDRDGAMSGTWMKAAGRSGIPSAFVVDREGKIAWIGHPSSGLDEAVEKALGDGAGE